MGSASRAIAVEGGMDWGWGDEGGCIIFYQHTAGNCSL